MSDLERLADRLAAKITPNPETTEPRPVLRRWGTVSAVNAVGTYDVNLGQSGVTLPGVRALGYGAFIVGEVVVVEFAGSDPLIMGGAGIEDGWHEPAWAAGWSNYGAPWTAKYRKVHGLVYIEGLATGGATGSTIFTLPPGYRPLTSTMRTQIAQVNIAMRVDYNADGTVLLQGESTGARAGTGWVSVAASFPAEQ